MKKMLIVFFLCFTMALMAQENVTSDNFLLQDVVQVENMLKGKLGADFIYPLSSDQFLSELKLDYCLIYPLLVVNGVVIRDEDKVNNFRNNYADKIGTRMFGRRVKGVKSFTQQEAIKLGIKDVPEDGVVWVTLPKRYIIDL